MLAQTFRSERKSARIPTVACKEIVLPLAGSVGAIFAGGISDMVFQLRRAPIAAVMLFLFIGGLSAWLFPQIPVEMWLMSLLCLIAIGFMT